MLHTMLQDVGYESDGTEPYGSEKFHTWGLREALVVLRSLCIKIFNIRERALCPSHRPDYFLPSRRGIVIRL